VAEAGRSCPVRASSVGFNKSENPVSIEIAKVNGKRWRSESLVFGVDPQLAATISMRPSRQNRRWSSIPAADVLCPTQSRRPVAKSGHDRCERYGPDRNRQAGSLGKIPVAASKILDECHPRTRLVDGAAASVPSVCGKWRPGFPEMILAAISVRPYLFTTIMAALVTGRRDWGWANYVGGWNGVTTGDFDGDGRMDIWRPIGDS